MEQVHQVGNLEWCTASAEVSVAAGDEVHFNIRLPGHQRAWILVDGTVEGWEVSFRGYPVVPLVGEWFGGQTQSIPLSPHAMSPGYHPCILRARSDGHATIKLVY